MPHPEDLFADTNFGRLALAKIKPTDPNFMLFEAGWMQDGGPDDIFQVKGAVHRIALRGPRKGQLCIMLPETTRTVYLTHEELRKGKEDAVQHPT